MVLHGWLTGIGSVASGPLALAIVYALEELGNEGNKEDPVQLVKR